MDHVIIGASAAGVSCIEAIRQIDKKSKITIISEEVKPLYSRSLLGYFLAGVLSENNLYFKKKDFFEINNVEAILGIRARRIDLKSRVVTLADGNSLPYGKLLIATGSKCAMPEVPGLEKKGVFPFRTIKEAMEIHSYLKKTKTAVILGGGLVVLRAAFALNRRGIIVKIVTKHGHILHRALESRAADLISRRLEEKSIIIIKNRAIKEITGQDSVKGIILDDGTRLDCELLIACDEIIPNTDLAAEAGIDTRKGILVDSFLRTSAPDVFAAGDVSENKERSGVDAIFPPNWAYALAEGKIAGDNMAGLKIRYEGITVLNSIEFFDMPITFIGVNKPEGKDFEHLYMHDEKRQVYKKIVLENDVVCGFMGVGQINNAGIYQALIKEKTKVAAVKSKLLDDDFSGVN